MAVCTVTNSNAGEPVVLCSCGYERRYPAGTDKREAYRGKAAHLRGHEESARAERAQEVTQS